MQTQMSGVEQTGAAAAAAAPGAAATAPEVAAATVVAAVAAAETDCRPSMGPLAGNDFGKRPKKSEPGNEYTAALRPVFELVARYLPVKSLARAMCTCTAWRDMGRVENLWHRHCALLYPSLLSPSVSKRIAETCGFYRFFRHRLLPPAKACPLPFSLDDVTFFFDLTLLGSPVFSHTFRYEGGNTIVPYSADCFVDSGAVFPSSDSLDKDTFRRSLTVNWTAVRHTDGKGSCLVRGCPDRTCACSINFEAWLSSATNGVNASGGGGGSPSSLPGGRGGSGGGGSPSAGGSPRQAAVAATASAQLPGVKMVFNTALGGAVGAQFYGMMKISFALPLRERFLHSRGTVGAAGGVIGGELTPVNVLSRSGGMEVGLTALKDRLGGTVRVDISAREFLIVLSALQWT